MDAPRYRPHASDIPIALALLTRLPLPHPDFNRLGTRPASHAAWAYPLVGIVTGGLAAVAGAIALTLGLPASVAAFAALLTGVLATGAMHEDGLADCADGFWGGWDRRRRLEIMKDSQIGTYGVIALILGFGLRWVALNALFETGHAALALIVAAAGSRAAMVGVMHHLPNARDTGLSKSTGRVPRGAALIAYGIAGAATLVLLPAAFLPLILVLGGTAVAAAQIARRKIGGQTGDVLGATQQLAEIAALLCCLTTTA